LQANQCAVIYLFGDLLSVSESEMSWLSQGLSDIGLGGLNTFYNSAIKPALENPAVDVGLGLGAAALTGGLLAPELGGLFGGTTAAADSLGGAAATGAAADAATPSLAASVPTALGFSGDVSPLTGDLSSYLANPFGVTGGASLPGSADLATASGTAGAFNALLCLPSPV
jgi:hypothetical protein